MLGVKYKEVPSYAVGFEEIVYMYPMNFKEYLTANGVQDSTFSTLQSCYEQHEKVPEVMHETLLKLFATYIVVGGMPDVVQTYVDTHDIGRMNRYENAFLWLSDAGVALSPCNVTEPQAPLQLNEKRKSLQ